MAEDSLKWKHISSEYLFNDTWLRARKDTCEKPDGKIVTPYYVMEYPTWVSGVALTEDGQVILIKQYRHALGENCIEIPGGCVDDTDKDYEAAIRRELLEETGYEFSDVKYLGRTSPNPSTNNNLMQMFLLQGGKKVQEQALDANEEIDVMLVSVDELIAMVRQNKIVQAMHVTAIFYALQHLKIPAI
jgi:8-oxo-dGTP pyrophosphatase MutT (NUDIX family)